MIEKLAGYCEHAESRSKSEIQEIRKRPFSDLEKQILQCAEKSMDGLTVHEGEQINGIIFLAGEKAFPNDQAEFSEMDVFHAFASLCKKGYVFHETGCLFHLSSDGKNALSRLGENQTDNIFGGKKSLK